MNTEGRVHRGPPFFFRDQPGALFFYMIAPQNRIAFCGQGRRLPHAALQEREAAMATGNAKSNGSADGALLIKRYASRRLYNTETSDYVTLDDIAGFIREGAR
jgi:hypothetical protein